MSVRATAGSSFSDINVTPMIDVLLVLLIVFMILSRDRYTIRSPVAPAGPVDRAVPSQLVLELPDGGGFLLNGQPVPDAMLDAQIAAAFEQRPVKLLFVDAGGERTYQEVIAAMDRARGAGVQVVALMPDRIATR
jgi:biopolymer transport protein ExbD